MGDISAHFSRWEFRDHTTGELIGPSDNLVEHLERLRGIVGRPIVIVSGYRSPSHNRAVGGARRSYHLLGRAADLRSGVVTVDQALAAGFGGIGRCGKWVVHVDDRRVAHPVIFDDC